jgi:hypothetical protein
VQAERKRAWDVIARVTVAHDGGTPVIAGWRRAEAVLGGQDSRKERDTWGPP